VKVRIKQLASVLKATGIVLICLAVALTIYVSASSGGMWKKFSEGLQSYGVDTNALDWARFGNDYYRAMGRAVREERLPADERAQHAADAFSGFAEKAEGASGALVATRTDEAWAAFEASFDTSAFLDGREGAEDGLLERERREIIEYLDSFTAVPKKGKLAKLKPASNESFYVSTWESFAPDDPEIEFLRAIRLMVEETAASGEDVKDIKAWITENLTEESYAAARTAVAAQERAEQAESLTEGLAGALADGGDAAGWLKEKWADIAARDQSATPLDYARAVTRLIQDSHYDGTVETQLEEMASERAGAQAESFDNWLGGFGASVVEEADLRSVVRGIPVFWALASWYVRLWIAGIALLIAGIVIMKLLDRRALSDRAQEAVRDEDDVLLRVDHLCQYFRSGDTVNKAVDDVSFFVRKGEVFGLVGESGCGKTTTGRTIINLYDPTSGDVYFKGLRVSSNMNGLPVLNFALRKDAQARISELRDTAKEEARAHPERAAQIEAQAKKEISEVQRQLNERLARAQDDAVVSHAEKESATKLYRAQELERLAARHEQDLKTLKGEALEECKRRYEMEKQAVMKDDVMTRMQMIFQDPIASIDPRMTVREIIAEGLNIRGITDKKVIDRKVYEMLDLVGLVSEHADRYPHEFSGGQRQRIGIARAIALEPELIIADEPISALDVSIQAQVINLLNELRHRMGLTIVFIAHNLSVVKYFSDRIAVMYYGHIVEMTTSDELFRHPLHPYTKALLSAIPYPDPHYEKTRRRLTYDPATAHDYSKQQPTLREVAPGHWIRCNDAEERAYKEELAR